MSVYLCGMGQKAAVVGASGYAGGELLRLLVSHPSLEIGPLCAGSSAGRLVGELHPHLTSLAERTLSAVDIAELSTCDIVFLALPHGESASIVEQLPESQPVIDLGADFRLEDSSSWTQYYGGSHAGAWTYGLPELPGQRRSIAEASRVANPGCYATAIALAAAPSVSESLGDPSGVVVVAASGTTGAGRTPKPGLLASEVMGSLSTYKVGGSHQHIPEIEQTLRNVSNKPVRLSFTPMLAPMPRGILATVSLPLLDAVSPQQLRDTYERWYRDEHFVQVLPEGRWPRTSDVVGTNAAHLQVVVDDHADKITVVTAIDNLGKGAAGQAVQNANLVLGFPEDTGLTTDGVAP